MMATADHKAGKRQVAIGIAIIGVVFFIIGFVSWVNSILIPYFRIACELTNYQSYFVTFSFYIAYLVMSVPVAYLLKRTGYKKGMMYGFFCLAAGALLFVPAALNRAYWIFLTGLFTMGTGLSVLQASANPYITIIGPIESAARRISIMGVCNKFAGIVSPLIFAAVVLGKSQDILRAVEDGLLSGADKEAALNELIRGVILPYSVLAVLLVGIGVFIYRSVLPDINPEDEDEKVAAAQFGQDIRLPVPLFSVGRAGTVPARRHAGDCDRHDHQLCRFDGSRAVRCQILPFLHVGGNHFRLYVGHPPDPESGFPKERTDLLHSVGADAFLRRGIG